MGLSASRLQDIENLLLQSLPLGTILEKRMDTSSASRTIFGFAEAGSAQTDAAWVIYAEDQVGTDFHRQFAEISGEPVVDFVHKWSERSSILPGVAFMNEFSIQLTGIANSYLTVADSPDIDFDNNDPFSISIYWKSSVSGAYDFVQKTSNTGGNNGYTLYTDSTGRLIFEFRGTGTGDRIRVRTDSFTSAFDGSWHHVLVTKDNTTNSSGVSLYVDGNDEVLNELNDTLSGVTTNSSILSMGANISGGSRFVGNLEELGIWNAELTSLEAAEIYNSNNGAIDLQSGTGQIGSALVSWWRMGDGSFTALPTIPDEEGANDATTQSAVTSGDIETETPP